MLSAFVFMPFLIRRFGIANYGVYLLASSVTGYLGLLDLGVGTAVIKFVAQYRARDDDEHLGELVSNVLVFYVIVGVVAAGFLAAFSRWGIGIFALDAEGARLAMNLFLAAAAVSLFSWPATLGGQVLTGLQDYPAVSKVGVAVVTGNVAATAVVLAIGEGPIVLLLANGVVGVLGGVAYALCSRKHMRGVRVSILRSCS
jgi:O-antigen/teichoic acid export membrane protein